MAHYKIDAMSERGTLLTSGLELLSSACIFCVAILMPHSVNGEQVGVNAAWGDAKWSIFGLSGVMCT